MPLKPLLPPLKLLSLTALTALSALLFPMNSKPGIIAHLLQLMQLPALAIYQCPHSVSVPGINSTVVVIVDTPDHSEVTEFSRFGFCQRPS
jgi:hypothetical protein